MMRNFLMKSSKSSENLCKTLKISIISVTNFPLKELSVEQFHLKIQDCLFLYMHDKGNNKPKAL